MIDLLLLVVYAVLIYMALLRVANYLLNRLMSCKEATIVSAACSNTNTTMHDSVSKICSNMKSDIDTIHMSIC